MQDSTDVRTAGSDAAPEKKPSSIERIQRLERLERERLEDKAHKEERRRLTVAGAKPSGGRHDVVDQIEEMTKYPMALLGIAWLIVAIIVLTTDVKGSASISLVGALFVLWVIMLIEYLVRLVISPDSRGYLKRRWAEPATVVLPVLQGWHLIGIEKMSLLLHEGELRLEAILKHHSLFRVLIAACVTLLTGAWLVRRWVPPKPQLATLREYGGLLVGAALLGPSLGATLGAAVLTTAGRSHSFGGSHRDGQKHEHRLEQKHQQQRLTAADAVGEETRRHPPACTRPSGQ